MASDDDEQVRNLGKFLARTNADLIERAQSATLLLIRSRDYIRSTAIEPDDIRIADDIDAFLASLT